MDEVRARNIAIFDTAMQQTGFCDTCGLDFSVNLGPTVPMSHTPPPTHTGQRFQKWKQSPTRSRTHLTSRIHTYLSEIAATHNWSHDNRRHHTQVHLGLSSKEEIWAGMKTVTAFYWSSLRDANPAFVYTHGEGYQHRPVPNGRGHRAHQDAKPQVLSAIVNRRSIDPLRMRPVEQWAG